MWVTNSGFGTVSVISDATGTTASPSQTVPEFSAEALILVIFLTAIVTFCAVALELKNAPNHLMA